MAPRASSFTSSRAPIGRRWASRTAIFSFFFPIFGILALAAFYLPAVVFTDLYWRHVRYGKLRFLLGAVVAGGVAYGVSNWLDAKPRSVWEVSPRALMADKGEPAGCGAPGGSLCQRAPVLATLAQLRAEGQRRLGLSKFARTCAVDPMLEVPEEMGRERYCFAAGARLTGSACCEAQRRFGDEVARLQEDPSQRSLSGTYDKFFLSLKVFFVLVVVAIGGLLAGWRDRIDEHYREFVPRLERGVIIGGLAMLLWPIMDYAYQQTANVMFGRWDAGVQLRLSLVIVPWALLLLFYFLRRLGKQGEMIGQIAGVVTAGVAVLRYEDLNDWAVRLLGTGTTMWIVGVMIAIAVAGFIALFRPIRSPPGPLGTKSATS